MKDKPSISVNNDNTNRMKNEIIRDVLFFCKKDVDNVWQSVL